METLQNVLKAIRLYTLPMTIPYNSNKHNSGNVRNLSGTYDYIFCLKHFLWVVSHNISGSCICEHANMPHRLHYMLRRYVFSILKLQRFDAQNGWTANFHSYSCTCNRSYYTIYKVLAKSIIFRLVWLLLLSIITPPPPFSSYIDIFRILIKKLFIFTILSCANCI